jgi:hypothetical protein
MITIWAVRITIVAAILGAVFWWGRCSKDEFNPDQPAEIIDSLDVVEDLDFGPEIPLLERPFTRSAPTRRAGVGPQTEEARERNVRYAAKVFVAESIPLPPTVKLAPEDTLPQLPIVRVTGEGALTLGVERSDGRMQRAEWDCGDGRKIEAGTTETEMFANCQRALPALLPRIGKTALTCAAVAGAGYGIAYLADYDKPELAAGAAGGACIIVRVF